MLTLFQLADSSFPTGAFAHSTGMEAWCAVLGRGGGDIETALGWSLRQSIFFSWLDAQTRSMIFSPNRPWGRTSRTKRTST